MADVFAAMRRNHRGVTEIADAANPFNELPPAPTERAPVPRFQSEPLADPPTRAR
jgi:hypothetical protein